MRVRINLIKIATLLAFIILISRFFYWQVVRSSDLSAMVRPQYERRSIESAYRGKIFANDGTVLVGQADAWNLFAEPKIVDDDIEISRILAPILVNDVFDTKKVIEEESRIKGILSDKEKLWSPISSRISSDVKEKIDAFEFRGIGFDRDEIRKYPEASVAAQLLGFLGKDDSGLNHGYFGLEGYYDSTLSSAYGVRRGETDVKGLPLLFGKSKKVPSFSGADLVTYIDKGVQLTVEEYLIKGVEKYGAISGSVIVMDPKTGGIMAMSSYPSFDPGSYWKYSNELFLNPVISASFEPGSIFKVITMASALDSGDVSPDTKCDICTGALRVGEYDIQTWNNKYYPESTMTDVIVHSDNVGMAFVSRRLGIEKNYTYLKKFGIGSKTGIDLQGEMTPPLRGRNDWKELDLITSSFGQGIAVTPIQMIASANVIANKGYYVVPKVVKNIMIDGKTYEVNNQDGKRVISDKAAMMTTMMMVEAAKSGESKWTYKKGFGVAGKTGTAQIPIAGHYDDEKTIASFVGFAPFDNPKFIMLVTLNEPKSSQWASETAAPLWYDISEKLFLHFGILPQK